MVGLAFDRGHADMVNVCETPSKVDVSGIRGRHACCDATGGAGLPTSVGACGCTLSLVRMLLLVLLDRENPII